MKNCTWFIAALVLLFTLSCTRDSIEKMPVTGTFKPTQKVTNFVANDNTTTHSETFAYNDCEQKTRWTFNADGSGSVTEYAWVNNNTCVLKRSLTFSYTYNSTSEELVLNYPNSIERGKIVQVKPSTMNLIIEEKKADGYHSDTYALVRVE